MKLTIERSQFLKSLSHAQSVVERANTIPILGNVMLEAADGRLRLSATDLELGAVETVDADAVSGGGTTLPAQVLYDIARKLPDGAQVELETEDGSDRIRLRCGRSTFTLSALPPEEFPELSKAEFACRFPACRRGPARPDRPDRLRRLHRGDALLPERHLPAHHRA